MSCYNLHRLTGLYRLLIAFLINCRNKLIMDYYAFNKLKQLTHVHNDDIKFYEFISIYSNLPCFCLIIPALYKKILIIYSLRSIGDDYCYIFIKLNNKNKIK